MFRAGSRGSVNRATDDVVDDDESGRAPFQLTLGDNIRLMYDDGNWTPVKLPEDTGDVNVTQLMQDNRKLKEENNLLKYKLEVVIDMLTEARSQLQSVSATTPK
eukprot:m.29496 g.29496  ORF g.29496 m.29496 type:complete len:104 (+) comp11947_c0_seq1:161-472(+)